MSRVSASAPSTLLTLQPKAQTVRYKSAFVGSVNPSLLSCLSDTKPKNQLSGPRFGPPTKESHRISVRCNSSTGSGGPGSGDNDSRRVLDAFFFGKALGEVLNERFESAVGEFLSTIGRLQAEQQKQIQDFQDDVFERAKKAKERAAHEAMEAQGLIAKPPVDTTLVTNGVTVETSPSVDSTRYSTAKKDSDPASEDAVLGVSSEK